MKELRIISSKIVVSAHGDKRYVHHVVKGILPNCRKVTTLHLSPSTGCVWVKSLWSHNGQANIEPSLWAALVKTSPVVSDSTFPVTLTPEIIADAYKDALSITQCPAVHDRTHVHPKYKTSFSPMVVVNHA
jgi:hypothetical protein